MSLVYRAIWQDDRTDLCARALADMRLWVGEKFDAQIEVPDQGSAEANVSVGKICQVEVVVEQAATEERSLTALRAAVAETGDDGIRWKTTLRVWQDSTSGMGFAWVDLSVVGDGLDMHTLAPAAPRLVRNMLIAAENPRLGSQPIWTSARSFSGDVGGEQLAELVSDFDRALPTVVFTRDDARFEVFGDIDHYTFDDVVSRVANQVAGVANVAVLDRIGARTFTDALGQSHGVWDGAFRVYLGNLDPATIDDAWRHRYVTAERYMGRFTTAAYLVARMLSSISPTRRPPESFGGAKRLIDEARTGKRDIEELAEYADGEIERRSQEVIALRQRVSELEEELFGFEDDRSELLNQLDAVTTRALELQQLIEEYDRCFLATSSRVEHPTDTESNLQIPLAVATPSDAVSMARIHLSDRLVIHDLAVDDRDLGKLDYSVNSSSWGRQAWRGFRALHAYASALASGECTTSFWYWCKDSGHPLAWPATTKRLAMTESETVRTTRKMRSQRMLPIASDVDPSGTTYMEAHLKVAEGGGDLAPRIYFHIDQPQAKVHVGYFGPHSKMKNTRS